jgi:alanine racemase
MSNKTPITDTNCWIEISRRAIEGNIAVFRSLVGQKRRLAAVVKANAYGHGMVPVARVALTAGADWLHVFSVAEGLTLRESGIDAPVLVLGPVSENDVKQAVAAGLRMTVASPKSADMVSALGAGGTVHLKLETGTNRQGIRDTALPEVLDTLARGNVMVEGAYTHFADIEDTTDHTFAEGQLERFRHMVSAYNFTVPHTACSAAAILFPDTYFEMVRVGIALYGLWPSTETHVSARMLGRNALALSPVMSWKTRVAQVNEVSQGEFIGYGRTFRTTRPSRIAILPVGYADGYDRGLSNVGHVLIRGVRAPIRGRICMNLCMADVTDIPEASCGDEVVLLGRQGAEQITPETLAKLIGTINYEIVTRAAPFSPRLVVD